MLEPMIVTSGVEAPLQVSWIDSVAKYVPTDRGRTSVTVATTIRSACVTMTRKGMQTIMLTARVEARENMRNVEVRARNFISILYNGSGLSRGGTAHQLLALGYSPSA